MRRLKVRRNFLRQIERKNEQKNDSLTPQPEQESLAGGRDAILELMEAFTRK